MKDMGVTVHNYRKDHVFEDLVAKENEKEKENRDVGKCCKPGPNREPAKKEFKA
jgi:hypothetical protein